jgi:hypothetical protein
MKNEKLELLLNKVVEYNNLERVNFKGFLYKDSRGYYIKVVEAISGTDIAVNDKLYLNDGEEEFITFAAKPKLMIVSLKSWHYKLMKYVLGDNTPTPKNMQNGCPYFWLLVLSMFVSPFVALWRGIISLIKVILYATAWCLEAFVNMWIRNVDDIIAYDIYYRGSKQMPKTAKIYFDKNEYKFFEYFINERYNINREISPEAYETKKKELGIRWEEWQREVSEKRRLERIESEKRYSEMLIRVAKEEARKKEWEARISPIKESFEGFFTSIGKAVNSFKLTADWKVLIRRTKQVVGAIITLIVLGCAYVVVNALASILTILIDWSIENWLFYLVILGLVVVAGIGYLLFIVIGSWLQSVINRYLKGRKIWYIEPLIKFVWTPIKYGVKYCGYVLLYLLWIPLKFIFYTVLWEIVLVNLGVYGWKLLKKFGKGLANSTGVFGEYFGASYSDYCPGIEWTDTEEE